MLLLKDNCILYLLLRTGRPNTWQMHIINNKQRLMITGEGICRQQN